jgi:Flp pilus assembly pilin Flp
VEDAMAMVTRRLGALARSDEGQDLIEYALLAALVAMAVMGAVSSLGGVINDVLWTKISGELNAL